MKVLLLQLDGKIPNLALMRLSAYHKVQGDEVEFRRLPTMASVYPELGELGYDRVYASLIFAKTRPVAEEVVRVYPQAILGGTGWDLAVNLEHLGIPQQVPDYTLYPRFRQSLGFTQRGCRLRCGFCVVPAKEGAVREEQSIWDLWRGDPWQRELLLLDNDFFGQPHWQQRIDEIRCGGFKVSFNQGINVRFLTDETAAALASVDYRDDSMQFRRIYSAWDNRKDEHRLFCGLELLAKHGVRPDHMMLYMLIGYWPGETDEDWVYRQAKLRAFGCRPYPMPYIRTPATIGFQRWVVGAYDKRIPWAAWKAAGYRPERLGGRASTAEDLFAEEAPDARA